MLNAEHLASTYTCAPVAIGPATILAVHTDQSASRITHTRSRWMPPEDRTVSHTWNAADAAAGSALVRQPTSSKPLYDIAVQNKLSSQLASHFESLLIRNRA
ncbi:unnamed protein product [Schistocephalus solidus]|uniref:Uncharacterized protein n=1 Tax=Schistocephalus solidus TaxID=70667 RepID=A0A183TL95_SCHSO|nr:unnamed protein product [Schistocephalus solidus]